MPLLPHHKRRWLSLREGSAGDRPPPARVQPCSSTQVSLCPRKVPETPVAGPAALPASCHCPLEKEKTPVVLGLSNQHVIYFSKPRVQGLLEIWHWESTRPTAEPSFLPQGRCSGAHVPTRLQPESRRGTGRAGLRDPLRTPPRTPLSPPQSTAATAADKRPGAAPCQQACSGRRPR